MPSLDELIREAARRGDLRSLTLWTTEQGYQASVSATGVSVWRVEIHADPVEALRRALGAPAVSVLANDTSIQEDIFG
ncbi:hypothetical protein [Aminobacter sp. BE322]|uniref:hypothetical protein n=1 Tax=unclassified Aminobacter TaxID=2644704 RepID=UPI003D1F6A8A